MCCRCSPTHKAQVVKLLQQHTKRPVCAVGEWWGVGGGHRQSKPATTSCKEYLIPQLYKRKLHLFLEYCTTSLHTYTCTCVYTYTSCEYLHVHIHTCVHGRERGVHVHVGDGGNDVSMIQAANVGLGIVGKVSFAWFLTDHTSKQIHHTAPPSHVLSPGGQAGISGGRFLHHSIQTHQ